MTFWEKFAALIFVVVIVASLGCIFAATGIWIVEGSVVGDSLQSRLAQAGGLGLVICFFLFCMAMV
jgi:hypothetical protein